MKRPKSDGHWQGVLTREGNGTKLAGPAGARPAALGTSYLDTVVPMHKDVSGGSGEEAARSCKERPG